jgi:hypothetical protein
VKIRLHFFGWIRDSGTIGVAHVVTIIWLHYISSPCRGTMARKCIRTSTSASVFRAVDTYEISLESLVSSPLPSCRAMSSFLDRTRIGKRRKSSGRWN